MAISHSTSTRNAIADTVCNQIAKLQILDSSSTVLVELNITYNPASGGTATASNIDTASAIAGGTASQFQTIDSSDNQVFSGSVAMDGSGDLDIDNTNIATGQTVQVNSASYTAPS